MNVISANINYNPMEKDHREYQNYINKCLNRDLGCEIAEKLKPSEPLIILPLGVKDVYHPYDYFTTRTLSALISPLPEVSGVNDILLASAILELLLKDSIIKIPPNTYYWKHVHYEPLSPVLLTEKPGHVRVRDAAVELRPVMSSDRMNYLGFVGKCNECGKIFWSEYKRSDV
jgi:hypothetical protein